MTLHNNYRYVIYIGAYDLYTVPLSICVPLTPRTLK